MTEFILSGTFRVPIILQTQFQDFPGLSSRRGNHASTPPLSFLQAGCHSCHPTNSVKAPKAHSLTYLLSFHYTTFRCGQQVYLLVHSKAETYAGRVNALRLLNRFEHMPEGAENLLVSVQSHWKKTSFFRRQICVLKYILNRKRAAPCMYVCTHLCIEHLCSRRPYSLDCRGGVMGMYHCALGPDIGLQNILRFIIRLS